MSKGGRWVNDVQNRVLGEAWPIRASSVAHFNIVRFRGIIANLLLTRLVMNGKEVLPSMIWYVAYDQGCRFKKEY